MFDAIIDRLNQDFEFNKSSDFLQVELVGVYSVKLVRAQIEGNTDAAEKLDRMIRAPERISRPPRSPVRVRSRKVRRPLRRNGRRLCLRRWPRPPTPQPRKPPAARNAERIADNTMEGFSDDPGTRRLAADDFSRNCG